jgi:hypothetical protein
MYKKAAHIWTLDYLKIEIAEVRWPIRVIHTQKVKSPHNITKHANKCAIHATIPRFTPQFHDSRNNFTIHATIPRFTPQFHDSRHKETADQSRSQYSLNSLFPAFSRNSMAV